MPQREASPATLPEKEEAEPLADRVARGQGVMRGIRKSKCPQMSTWSGKSRKKIIGRFKSDKNLLDDRKERCNYKSKDTKETSLFPEN